MTQATNNTDNSATTLAKTAEMVADYCMAAKSKVASPVASGKTRVAVAMSGGVDSSTTALILREQGYDVVGITGWLIKSGSRCCDTGMIDAARVCEQLDIEHHAVDLRELFKSEIIDQFHESYAKAQTPLPCSVCNTVIKWTALLNYGRKHLHAPFMATGHYARIVDTPNGKVISRAKDQTKDQSYVLWGLTRDQIDGTLLPLGDYTKDEIRAIANANGLVTANRPDSQDLCFIPKGQTTQSYLAQFLPEIKGEIVHVHTGEIMGEHKGTHNYTIGQRRGIGVAHAEPLYVVRLDVANKRVYVGPKDALFSHGLTASSVNWTVNSIPQEPFEALAKIRYNSKPSPATVEPLANNRVKISFQEPQSAVTSGQVLGIYDLTDTYLIGGGWID